MFWSTLVSSQAPSLTFAIIIFFLFQSQNIIDPLRTKSSRNSGRLQPPFRASIRTLNGPFWARCKLGFDRKPRSITNVMNLGLLGAAI